MPQSPVSNERNAGDFANERNKWDDADRWIIELDRWSRRIGQEAGVFRHFLSELLKILGSRSGQMQFCCDGRTTNIASVGEQLPEAIDDDFVTRDQATATLRIRWTQRPDRDGVSSDDCDVFRGVQTIDRDVRLVIVAKFDKRLDSATRQRCEELVTAAIDLITPTCLRYQRQELERSLAAKKFQEQLVDLSFLGTSLTETVAEVAAQIATKIGYERVVILQVVSRQCTLIATSTLATIDRRARQARLLEELATACVAEKTSVRSIAESDGRISGRIDKWLRSQVADSGATDIRIDLLANPTSVDDPVAVLVSERFSEVPPSVVADDEIETALSAGTRAIVIAITRHGNGWNRVLVGRTDRAGLLKWRLIQLAIVGLLFTLAWLPVELRVHATGRLLPQVRQRIFAPIEGVVTAVHVVNGQTVSQGDRLVEIHSAALDLTRQQVLSEIATSKVRLASLLAARTRSTSGANRGGTSGGDFETLSGGELAANEETLKAQLAGLQEQLKLIDTQRSVLRLTSPINGVAMRWDMNQTLYQRPVAAGQFLLDVISEHAGWIVELDVPDAEIGYLQAAFSERSVACNFRFRSNPSVAYAGQVSAIDSAAQLDSAGESVVRVVVPVPKPTAPSSLQPTNDVARVNAGVLASIDCGKRPLIVVYTRGLVRWARVHLGW